jgi:hypothetical protein
MESATPQSLEVCFFLAWVDFCPRFRYIYWNFYSFRCASLLCKLSILHRSRYGVLFFLKLWWFSSLWLGSGDSGLILYYIYVFLMLDCGKLIISLWVVLIICEQNVLTSFFFLIVDSFAANAYFIFTGRHIRMQNLSC